MSAYTSTFLLAFVGFLFLAAVLYVTGREGRRPGCCLAVGEDPANPEECGTCPSRTELKTGDGRDNAKVGREPPDMP